MKSDLLNNVLTKLASIEWCWEREALEAVAQELGYQRKEAVPGRVSYSIDSKGSVNFSLYLSEDTGAPEFVEITFDRYLESETLSDMDYEDMVDDYFAKFNEAADLATVVLGKPKFRDGFGNPGFPDDQEAQWLALWPRKDARFMVTQRHEDREAPFRICLVITPPV